MAQPPAGLALDGGDPRLSSGPTAKMIHDPNVTFEEYVYYAKIERAREKQHPDVLDLVTSLKSVLGKKKVVVDIDAPSSVQATQATKDEKGIPRDQPPAVAEEEWYQASRALRTATWGAVFYLITTDVLGPYSVPWALSQMGYGPGVTLYTIFGLLAGYTGWQIWQMFLRLDSSIYPLKSFGDIAFRVYGSWARHSVNILQSLQLIFNVGVIVIQNGQGLYQINSNICYVACCIIWVCSGMMLGQIRTLQKFGWVANLAIWINIVVMILTMVIVSHSPPNYTASEASNGRGRDFGPISTYASAPPYSEGFQTGISGLMQAVYSYGGALIFCEFMSEMRKPGDFWKALLIADSFIYVTYLFFGLYVYSFHGEFVVNPAFQGISPQSALKAGNTLGLISALIAGALYGNIGVKVIYTNILREFFNAPPLDEKLGKFLWVGLVPLYWAVAFVLAAAIPNFPYLLGLVAAVCILQFTYTIPPLMMLGCDIQYHSIREAQGEGFDPATGQTKRLDDGWKRWLRGAKTYWYVNVWNLLFFFGALVTAALGMYSSIQGLKMAFATGRSTSFSCKGPLGSG
ncbi:amino acid transporter [Lindgomyces ingoldianus]|uniref:Amino acid transporter n=1 Tax=Lindgomyces ingoldianus TaxID=673940 RepID=A0ACB6QKY1_9PLEO|nr:amino acid transporter [Lindgomyces ingoldianus]KAF2466790.1 amino acid transporter [Lindgomyces ingoldianus]